MRPVARRFLQTDATRAAAIGLFLVAVVALAWSLKHNVGASEAAALSRVRTYVCAETGKPFAYELRAGDTSPVPSPHSGRKTGYPAELCFWTADGRPKAEPTPVLLNVLVGKPGPTFCPDCARLVVGRNPGAEPGAAPPPTREAYEQRRAARSTK